MYKVNLSGKTVMFNGIVSNIQHLWAADFRVILWSIILLPVDKKVNNVEWSVHWYNTLGRVQKVIGSSPCALHSRIRNSAGRCFKHVQLAQFCIGFAMLRRQL